MGGISRAGVLGAIFSRCTMDPGEFRQGLGSSALWGTFDSGFSIPAGVHGNVTLEVYEVSPKDGSEQGLVQIPLSVP